MDLEKRLNDFVDGTVEAEISELMTENSIYNKSRKEQIIIADKIHTALNTEQNKLFEEYQELSHNITIQELKQIYKKGVSDGLKLSKLL